MDASWHPSAARLGPLARIALLLACILALGSYRAHAAPNAPVITTNTFDSGPRKLNYFLDSPVILYQDISRNILRSPDEGKTWTRIQDIPEGKSWNLIMHAFDPKIAFVLTQGKTHYKTTDQGVTWRTFETDLQPIEDHFVLSFHAKRPDLILFIGVNCDVRGRCYQETLYTKDGFATRPKKLLSYTHKCEWAVSSPMFDEAPVELIHCLEFRGLREDGSTTLDDAHLVKSQDYFATKQPVVLGTADRSAVVNFVTKESFLLAAEKHLATGDMSLYVSLDARTWAKASFPLPSGLRQDSYTILESTEYSLVVDVKANAEDTFGNLMLSNSNGTYFVRAQKYTNRNKDDTVDFEKVQNIDGVYIVNVVHNYDSYPRDDEKQLRTQITFEAGASWQYIMPPETGADGRRHPCNPNADGSCSLHLHSVTSAMVAPPVFSSKAAPGVVMGVGNVGPYLLPWEECDTFLSEDGGITWKAVLQHPHKYEFGDQGGLIVAVRDDNVPVTFFQYSADRGQTWQKHDFGESIRPGALISDPESSSQKFLLFVRLGTKAVGYQLDLTNVYGRKCELIENNPDRSDYEKWYARNVRNNPDCLMGVKTWYYRRKANAECMVQESFKDPRKTEETCACTDEDFECDYNYVLKDGKCEPEGKEIMREGDCKKEGDSYLASSGYRKIPGNSCDSEKGIKKDEPVTKKCSAASMPTDITHSVTKFDSPMLGGFQYFLKSSVVMLLTESKQVWRSEDDGTTWKRILPDAGHIYGIFIHDENEKQVYLISAKDLHVSRNNGETFDRHDLPAPPNVLGLPLIDFHPDSDKYDWMLYLGQKEDECFTRLYRTKDAGRSWAEVDTWVDKAVYASHRKLDMPDLGIFAMSWKKPMPKDKCQDELTSTAAHPLQMVYMLDADKQRLVFFDHVVQFYVVDAYLAVAVEVANDFVLYVSLNGHDFAQAVFPPNIRVDKNGFTVLQSTTGALVVDVAKSVVEGREYGRLFKSNENGTFYSLQLDNTNRNSMQLVDWEKIGGIEGVILANQVVNIDSLTRDGEKHIRSLISFNDGGNWNPIRAPVNSPCRDEDCSLQLHSVTDYRGPGAVFSAPSSVGLVMGVGNVGKHLLSADSAQTFLSRDAGKTWRKVSDRSCLYEFGDEGGVLVLADPSVPTQEVMYSYDFGTIWQKATFADAPVHIQSITTEPTSHTSKITITGKYVNGDQQFIVSTMDFGNRPNCVLDKKNPEKSDFEKWSPLEGEEDRCILGREIIYWRRKPEKTCRVNDNDGVPDTEQVKCKCTKKDFECDIGFFRDDDGSCSRFGYDPEKPKVCQGTYMSRSGFRKIQASQCEDGLDLEKERVERRCGAQKPVESKVSAFRYRYEYGQDTLFYFPNSDIAMLKLETHIFISQNDGKDWEEIQSRDVVTGLFRHPYDNTRAIIGTSGQVQYITKDRGMNWDPMEMRLQSASMSFPVNPWSFHPTEPDWIIYLGEVGCSFDRDDHCHIEAFLTLDGGTSWNPLASWVRSCSWSRDTRFTEVSSRGIYCEEYEDKSGSQKQLMNSNTPVRLIFTDNFMASHPRVLFNSIVGYAIYSEYLIAAEAYTVLDSTTRSIFMAVNLIDRRGSKVGSLFTSDSNGTYFSLSNKYVSESDFGNVDFEKMQGVDGVALLNQVANPNEANQGKQKQLRTMITVDNGNSWKQLIAPQYDSDSQQYDCQGEDCSLHLHNYLDRKHAEDMFSSPSIPGMVIGVGNVGKTLGEYAQGNTFLTRNGGHSWKEVLRGPHQYDFGDHGSIILLVKDDERPTDHVIYSLDHGKTFTEYAFTTEKVIVKDIMTKPGGIGKSFLLFAVPQPGGIPTPAKQLIFHIDFEGLGFPPCSLNLKDEQNDDFERWSIEDATGEKCTFGRQLEYYIRLEDRQCFVGELPVNPGFIETKCQCTRKDFECDYNYEPDGKGNCVLIEGAQPLVVNEKEVCEALPEGQDFYYESIGYRKMAFSSCTGDHELFGKKKYCPGKGGLGFFGILGVVVASCAGALGLLWLLNKYRNGRGPAIRLGNDIYDHIHMPRASSLPSIRMPTIRLPRNLSRSFSRIRVPGFVSKGWDVVASAAGALVPRRLRRYFGGGGGGYRYQNLSQEPGEVIMDDYFDSYLDDDEDDNAAETTRSDGLLGHGDGLQDAQERFRDDSDDDLV
ncbi:vacuolar protein sorting/targeting protein PEP1 [Mortierella sp. GBA43]|nr:vacuolar protein sorting/targeting protein PEP1 [Mortierella sp. GBA43]